MAKKIGKLLLGATIISVAAAAIVYLTKGRSDDDLEDIFSDDFDDDDFELDEDLDAVKSDREYVSLNPSSDSETESETKESSDAEPKTAETATE